MKHPSKKILVHAITLAFSASAFNAFAEKSAEPVAIQPVVVQGILPDRLEAVLG